MDSCKQYKFVHLFQDFQSLETLGIMNNDSLLLCLKQPSIQVYHTALNKLQDFYIILASAKQKFLVSHCQKVFCSKPLAVGFPGLHYAFAISLLWLVAQSVQHSHVRLYMSKVSTNWSVYYNKVYMHRYAWMIAKCRVPWDILQISIAWVIVLNT